jgi:hypothetical protein
MEVPDNTKRIKIHKLQIKCAILIISVLAIVGVSTMLGTKVFATEVSPTYQIQKIASNLNNKIDTNSI